MDNFNNNTEGNNLPREDWHGINHTSSWKEMHGSNAWREPSVSSFTENIQEYFQWQVKQVRRKVSHLSAGILIYFLIVNILAVILSFSEWGYSLDDGAYMIIILTGAMPAILLYMRKRDVPLKQIYRVRKPMTVKAFLQILCVFMMGQMIFSWFDAVLELILNQFGYTAADAVASATSGSYTWPMLIYAGLIAPVYEEFLYRGFVMQNLEKYSKVYAIIVSSVFFGFMHGNIVQIPFAFVVGLVLGYTAMEYSIWASMFLHFVNNFVFGDLLSRILEFLPEAAAARAEYYILFALFFAGLAVLIKRRSYVREYLHNNRIKPGQWKALFTSIPFWVFIVYFSIEAVLSISAM